jgi:outer membrane protein assembly factor BamB
LPAYDPPHHFSSTAVNVGSGPVALAGGVAYSYTDTSVVATTLATGSQRWSVPLPDASGLVTGAMNQDQTTTSATPVIVADATGGNLIVAVYPITFTGSGTQQDTAQIQVVAVNPTGQIQWKQTITASYLLPRVVGGLRDTRGAAVVIDGGSVTAVLDADSGATWWTVPNIQPVAVDGDVVIGAQSIPRNRNWSPNDVRARR